MIFREAYEPFRALGAAIELFRKSPVPLLVGGGLLWICFWGQQGHPDFGEKVEDVESAREVLNALIQAILAGWLTPVLAFLGCGLMLACWLFECLLRIGYAATVERVMVSGNGDIAELFRGRGRYGSMVLVTILEFIISVAALIPGIALAALFAIVTGAATKNGALAAGVAGVTMVVYLPVVVYFWLGISLAVYAVAIEDMKATEAIARSWSLVRGHRWTLFVYWLVMVVLNMLGFCCCCLFPSLPITHAALNESYLRLVRQGEPSTWVPAATPMSA